MRIYNLIIVLTFLSIICYGQNSIPVAGTRLILDLPSEFKEDRNIPGFRSEIDSTLIFVTEIKNPYSFDELVQKRITNSLKLGIDTSNFKNSTYAGYKSIQFNTYNPLLNQFGFTVNFGTDSFLIDISLMTSSKRLKEIEKLVSNGRYNNNLNLNYEGLLGFKVSYNGTNHKVFKKDANTINTKEKDELGNIISWLNITRMPKSSFEGLSLENSINLMYNHYFPDKVYSKTDSTIIDGSKLLWNVYFKDHNTFKEYAIIGIIPKKEFDLLIMGGVNSQEKLNEIFKIVNSIKFN